MVIDNDCRNPGGLSDEEMEEMEAMSQQEEKAPLVDPRIRQWDEFSAHMREYIVDKTLSKYKTTGMNDLAGQTPVSIKLWCVQKYLTRLSNGMGKAFDFEKMAHYLQMAWSDTRENPHLIDKPLMAKQET